MDILIKGMEMPEDTGSITVTIYSDGSTGIWTEQEMISGGMAVALPEHGRLVDADKLAEEIDGHGIYMEEEVKKIIDFFPVVVEAST